MTGHPNFEELCEQRTGLVPVTRPQLERIAAAVHGIYRAALIARDAESSTSNQRVLDLTDHARRLLAELLGTTDRAVDEAREQHRLPCEFPPALGTTEMRQGSRVDRT